jgi:anti-sigma regulatory factor (Ser/Thr protein kinase)
MVNEANDEGERNTVSKRSVVKAHWTLPCEASSVGHARGALRSLLRGEGSSIDESNAATMVVSELMTNAVVHSDDRRRDEQIEVVIECSDRQIHIEVLDHDPRPPVPRDIDPDAPSGRGLTIVDALSSAWGWDPVDGMGKRVWCDVPRAGCQAGGQVRPLGPRPQGPTPRLRSGI